MFDILTFNHQSSQRGDRQGAAIAQYSEYHLAQDWQINIAAIATTGIYPD